MINKVSGKAGMTLIEMLASLLIMVLLAVGMNTGMAAGLRVYQESQEATNRTMLASSINTKLTDILRYAEVKTIKAADNKEIYVFTNLEYGLWDVAFAPDANGIVQVYFYDKDGKIVKETPLINSASYSGFKVSNDFAVEPYEDNKGIYFTISYMLINTSDNSSSDPITAVVRVMNE